MNSMHFRKKNIINKSFALLASVLFFSSCSQSIQFTTQEKTASGVNPMDYQWINKLFNDLFLDESAIYTLWGTKPMTIIDTHLYSKEEIDAWLKDLSEVDKKRLVYKDSPYDIPENWDKWEKISHQFPLKKYLFFKKSNPSNPKSERIFFVDILQTALIMEKHYEVFSRITGMEFDSLDTVFELQDKESEFWDKVLDSCILTGILLGFGERNAWCFEWNHWKNEEFIPDESIAFRDALFYRLSDSNFTQKSSPQNPLKISIANFAIPAFASFYQEGEDPMIKKYQMERQHIQKLYKGKDFLDFTLKRLMH